MCIALFCIMAERMKHIIHAQHSFRFLAEHHKTLVNGTLAKRLTVEAKRPCNMLGRVLCMSSMLSIK